MAYRAMAKKTKLVSKVKKPSKVKKASKVMKDRGISRDDVELLFKMAEIYNTEYDFKATEWFWRVFIEDEFMAFRSKYPQGSWGAQLFERFTSRFEHAGVLVEHGFLSEDLYFDRYGSLQAEWAKCEPIISGLRGEWHEPRFRENFELLATKGRHWVTKHPPRIKRD